MLTLPSDCACTRSVSGGRREAGRADGPARVGVVPHRRRRRWTALPEVRPAADGDSSGRDRRRTATPRTSPATHGHSRAQPSDRRSLAGPDRHSRSLRPRPRSERSLSGPASQRTVTVGPSTATDGHAFTRRRGRLHHEPRSSEEDPSPLRTSTEDLAEARTPRRLRSSAREPIAIGGRRSHPTSGPAADGHIQARPGWPSRPGTGCARDGHSPTSACDAVMLGMGVAEAGPEPRPRCSCCSAPPPSDGRGSAWCSCCRTGWGRRSP